MRSLFAITVFSAFIAAFFAAFFAVMSAAKANNDRAEAECRAMVREAMRDYPSMAMQVIDDCAGFRAGSEGSIEIGRRGRRCCCNKKQ